LVDDSYFCHIVIPCRDYEKTGTFFEKVFGWKVEPQAGTGFMDVLPPSGKGPSAELNCEERVVVPTICVGEIDAKLALVQKLGGKKLKGKTPIGEKGEFGYYALFEDPVGNKMCLYGEK